jgi:thiopeptide-type bacteriocin biosynthesis protein
MIGGLNETSRRAMQAYTPEAFFVLRTPFFSYKPLIEWWHALDEQAGTNAHGANSDSDYLRDFVAQPTVREMLFLASPDLEHDLDKWARNSDPEASRRFEYALVRYFSRMCSRSTPFAFFAAIGRGRVAEHTHLSSQEPEKLTRATRLDMHVLCAVVQLLESDSGVRDVIRYGPTSSLYQLADRFRFVKADGGRHGQEYSTSSAATDEALKAVIEFTTKEFATIDHIARILISADVSVGEAKAYVQQLINAQLLVSELEVGVTGGDQLSKLVALLRERNIVGPVVEILQRVREQLKDFDSRGLGVPTSEYRDVIARLRTLPIAVEDKHVFQCDLGRDYGAVTIGRAVVDDVKLALSALYQVNAYNNLRWEAFAQVFRDRFEQETVPLTEVLDPDNGILDRWDAENTRMTAEREYARRDEMRKRDRHLAAIAMRAFDASVDEVELSADDLKLLAGDQTHPLPDAFSAMFSIDAASSAAVAAGDYHVVFQGVLGPSGAVMLGRFAHLSEQLREDIAAHLTHEESIRPNEIYAEVVHLPEARIGNILTRPTLRRYEIPYLATPSVPKEDQIPLSDLLLAVEDGAAVLYSARLGVRVHPRITSAHAYMQPSQARTYRFLASIQEQGIARGLFWDWGHIAEAPRLPRVTYGRIVLSRAQWCLDRSSIANLLTAARARDKEAVASWRSQRGIPEVITLVDSDNELRVSFASRTSVRTFAELIRNRDFAMLREVFPTSDSAAVSGPDGPRSCEIILPFVRRPKVPSANAEPRCVSFTGTEDRRKPPGSEWIFYKIYAGEGAIDTLISDWWTNVVQPLRANGSVDDAFFLRYRDPESHVRVRLRLKDRSLVAGAMSYCAEFARAAQRSALSWRITCDTYVREIERYGGLAGMELCEHLFSNDSQSAVRISARYAGDQHSEARRHLVVRSIDLYLAAFGLDEARRLALARSVLATRMRNPGSPPKDLLASRFRKERSLLEAALVNTDDLVEGLRHGGAMLDERQAEMKGSIAELQRLAEMNMLCTPLDLIVRDLIHVGVNRLCRRAANYEETTAWAFLARMYDARLARDRAADGAASDLMNEVT